MNKISYSAVVLDEKSHSLLIENLATSIPSEWKKFAHHMTINMGEINPKYEEYLGMNITLRVKTIGIGEKVIAVGVEGFPSANNIPHITIAVDTINGGKPFMSNKITNWRPIQFGFELKGKITEVPHT